MNALVRDEAAPGPVAQGRGARLVFVYGTLRAGGSNDINSQAPAAQLLGRARVRGRLYDLGAYPGLVLGGQDWVLGEVYAITPRLEVLLDEIEEVWPQRTGEYFKQDTWVTLDPPRPSSPEESPGHVRCMLYQVHPLRVAGRPRIDGGDWLSHVRPSAS